MRMSTHPQDFDWDMFTVPTLDGDFEPPKDVIELLERCHMFAEDEHHWTHGKWIEVDIPGAARVNASSRIADNPLIDFGTGVDWSKVSCTNPSGCAMAIVAICSRNGALIRADKLGYLNMAAFLAFDPVAAEAVKYTWRGMRIHRGLGDRVGGSMRMTAAGMREEVIAYNDAVKSHHGIVESFRIGLELARKEKAEESAATT